MNKLNFYICLFLPAILISCSEEPPASKVAARVNNSELTVDMIKDEIPEELQGKIKSIHLQEYVNRWIDNQILYQEAKRRGLDKNKNVRREIEKAKQQITINYLLDLELRAPINISEQDIQSYYDKHKEEFIRPEDTVNFMQIVVDNRKDAVAIRNRIRAGEKFEDVAKEKSIHESAENSGQMGWVWKSALLPVIAKTAFQLKKGRLSKIIHSEIGYHLIIVNDVRLKDKIQELDEVEQIIRERVKHVKEPNFIAVC